MTRRTTLMFLIVFTALAAAGLASDAWAQPAAAEGPGSRFLSPPAARARAR